MNEGRKREDYRYNKEDFGGWGYGGQYNNKITDAYYGGGDYNGCEFFRPDGDIEGKDVNWCLSNGFFMIKPGLWSGPWYFNQFPHARKENWVGQRGHGVKDADVIIPSTMPQNDVFNDMHYDEFFPTPPYFTEDDSFHLEPFSPTLGRVLVISDEAQSEIESDFRAKRVVSTFESAGYVVEAWKFGGLEIREELRRGAFNIIIMLGNVDDDSSLFSLLLREWIHKAGGLLFVNGEGNAMERLFEDVFNASWRMAEYRRYTHYPGNAI